MVTWNWDENQGDDGVVHESVANTDHNTASDLIQGYDYTNFSEITPDPTYCWPFHEDTGTTLYDVAGTADGTHNGPVLGDPGLLGTTSADYDNTDDYSEVGSFAWPSGSWTCSVWLSPAFGESSSDDENWIGIQIDSNNNLQLLNTGDSWSWNWSNSNNPWTQSFTTGEWYNTTCVCDNAGSGSTSATIYWDGQEVQSFSGVDTVEGTAPLIFGQNRRLDDAKVAEGRIAEVRFYDGTQLTQTQVQTLVDVVKGTGDWVGSTKTL